MCAATIRLRSIPPWPPPLPTRSSSCPTPARRWAASRARSSGVSATELGATAVKAAVERAGHHRRGDRQGVHGQRAFRAASARPRRARRRSAPACPSSAEAVTINKVCGSGMQAAIFAHDMLDSRLGRRDRRRRHGEHDQRALSCSKKHRAGARIGHDTVYDHMMLDGLEDAYEPGRAMGTFAEDAAREYQFTREQHGRLCDREPAPRQRGDRQRQVREGNRRR